MAFVPEGPDPALFVPHTRGLEPSPRGSALPALRHGSRQMPGDAEAPKAIWLKDATSSPTRWLPQDRQTLSGPEPASQIRTLGNCRGQLLRGCCLYRDHIKVGRRPHPQVPHAVPTHPLASFCTSLLLLHDDRSRAGQVAGRPAGLHPALQ